MPNKLYAQGDIILELVEEATPCNTVRTDADGAVVLARGEVTGHRHAFYGSGVAMFRDEALARDMPAALYIGHVNITVPAAHLQHEEHATISLPAGTYRVRRQQEWEFSLGGSQLHWE